MVAAPTTSSMRASMARVARARAASARAKALRAVRLYLRLRPPPNSNSSQFSWICTSCNSVHPFYHKECYQCHHSIPAFADGKTGGKAGNKRNRWAGSSPNKAPAAPASPAGKSGGKGNNDTDMEIDYVNIYKSPSEKFDISTPTPSCSKDEIQKVLNWLKSKKANDNILEEIHALHKQDEAPLGSHAAEDIDPWPALQSAKAKLQNVEKALINATVKKQDWLENTSSAVDDLYAKKQELLESIEPLQAKVLGTPTTDKMIEKLRRYDDLLSQIRSQIQHGLPESQTPERNKLYKLIFEERTDSEAEPQDGDVSAEKANDDDVEGAFDDTINHVDRSGFGFGPVAGSKGDRNPYAKKPTGKGTGGSSPPSDAPAAM